MDDRCCLRLYLLLYEVNTENQQTEIEFMEGKTRIFLPQKWFKSFG